MTQSAHVPHHLEQTRIGITVSSPLLLAGLRFARSNGRISPQGITPTQQRRPAPRQEVGGSLPGLVAPMMPRPLARSRRTFAWMPQPACWQDSRTVRRLADGVARSRPATPTKAPRFDLHLGRASLADAHPVQHRRHPPGRRQGETLMVQVAVKGSPGELMNVHFTWQASRGPHATPIPKRPPPPLEAS